MLQWYKYETKSEMSIQANVWFEIDICKSSQRNSRATSYETNWISIINMFRRVKRSEMLFEYIDFPAVVVRWYDNIIHVSEKSGTNENFNYLSYFYLQVQVKG
jgi:hypothetical protein